MSLVICSKCRQGFNDCRCETFQPNTLNLEFGEAVNNYLLLTKDEAKELARYFLGCGYISYEDYPKVHEILDRKIFPFIKDNR